ncbi:MAG: GerAB/ArcD/ProY family transporter [Acetivibrionales bacterium]
MQKRLKFGKWETVTLLINLICSKIFLSYTRLTAEDAGTAGWLSSIISCITAVLIFTILMRLYKRFESNDILDIAEIAGGIILRMVTGLAISAISLIITVTVLREYSEDIKVIVLPTSPLSYVMMFFAIGMCVGCFFGIEAIVRFAAITVPIIAAGYIFIILGVIPQMEFVNLFPVLGTGLDDIAVNGILRSSIFIELLTIFLLPPFLRSSDKVGSAGYIALGLSSFFLVTGSLAFILTVSYPVSLEPFLPIYYMASLFNLGRFFERIESLFVIIWSMAALLYLSSTFYFTVYTFARAAGLKYMRPLILPFIIIVFGAAFLPENLITVIRFEADYVYKSIGIVALAITAIIMAAANLKEAGKKGGPR